MINPNKYTLWARMGYAARGVIYLTIGTLAILSALGEGGSEADSKGAILSLKSQPFGEALLIVLVIGLVGYILWRAIQGIGDADDHGRSAKGLAVRSGLIISAISHSVLCFWIIKLLLHNTDDSSGQSASSTLSDYVGSDLTAWLVGLVGVIVIGVGLAHLYKGYTCGFKKYMAFPADKSEWMTRVCQFGLIARGVVWGIVGWVVLRSAIVAGSSDKKGISDAFEWLRTSPFGTWLILIVAAGLFAFGVYSFLEAMYRRISK